MKSFALAIALLGLPIAGLASPQADVMSVVHSFLDAFNKGDMKAAATMISGSGMVIVDDIAPHVWSGADTFATWSRTLAAANASEGNTDDKVVAGKPIRLIVSRDRGYVVAPVVYTFNQKGKAMRETAEMVFTLQKGTASWLITSFTWAGGKPAAAAATQ